MMKREEMRLHFVGIGGIGMSGIAEVFLNQGYSVSGSDLRKSAVTQRLESLGGQIAIGHDEKNLDRADVVVISTAVKKDNPEVVAARKKNIPVIPRAEMLGELMRGKTGIAIAGSHGKTTTASLLGLILNEGGLDPTLVIGGIVESLKSNAKLGQGDFVVAEADESDGSFLHLPATFAVVTNIDNDHLDHFGTIDQIDQAFVDFVGKIPFYGFAAVCGDDPGIRRCSSKWTKPVVTYGIESEGLDYVAINIERLDGKHRFDVLERDRSSGSYRELGAIELQMSGRHNVLNALGAIVVANQLGVSWDRICSCLSVFEGVQRRFQWKYRDDSKKIGVVDDYGHHPTEIRATVSAAREAWEGRVVCVFQPHRYSRTLHCRDGFLSAFAEADVTLITDIFSAGEEPIEGVDSESLSRSIQAASRPDQTVEYTGSIDETRRRLKQIIQPGDLVLCSGAGSITQLPNLIVEDIGSDK